MPYINITYFHIELLQCLPTYLKYLSTFANNMTTSYILVQHGESLQTKFQDRIKIRLLAFSLFPWQIMWFGVYNICHYSVGECCKFSIDVYKEKFCNCDIKLQYT
jgi:hypothetical protein